MRVWREVGSDVTEAQVRRVVASTVGVGAVARRLGVAEYTARRWAGLAGVSIVPHAPTTRMPERQRMTDDAVRDAMLDLETVMTRTARRPVHVALAAAEGRAARPPAADPAEMTAEDVAWLHALPDYEPPAAPTRYPADGAWLRDLLMRAR